jgi:hypothetical protein
LIGLPSLLPLAFLVSVRVALGWSMNGSAPPRLLGRAGMADYVMPSFNIAYAQLKEKTQGLPSAAAWHQDRVLVPTPRAGRCQAMRARRRGAAKTSCLGSV